MVINGVYIWFWPTLQMRHVTVQPMLFRVPSKQMRHVTVQPVHFGGSTKQMCRVTVQPMLEQTWLRGLSAIVYIVCTRRIHNITVQSNTKGTWPRSPPVRAC